AAAPLAGDGLPGRIVIVEGDGVPVIGVGVRVLGRCHVNSEFVVSLAEESGKLPTMTDSNVSPCRRQSSLASSEERELAGPHIPAGHLPVEAFDVGIRQRQDLRGQSRDRHIVVRIPEPRLDPSRPGELHESDPMILRIRGGPEMDESKKEHHQAEDGRLDDDRHRGSLPPPQVVDEEGCDCDDDDTESDFTPDSVWAVPFGSEVSSLTGCVILLGGFPCWLLLERREIEISCLHRKTLTSTRRPRRGRRSATALITREIRNYLIIELQGI